MPAAPLTTEAERADNAAWVAELLDEPVAVEVVDRVLATIRTGNVRNCH